MIYSKLNAYDAYDAGLKTRIDQKSECGPMPFSIYKLLECHRDFHENREELDKIGGYIRGNTNLRHSLRHCTSEDKHIWAKRTPAQMCHSLGRNLVGVLHGLTGDGVTVTNIKNIEAEVLRRLPDLLGLGEMARVETKKHWRLVGRQLGTGQCAIDEFVDKCVDLIDWVMDAVIASEPTSPSGPFDSFVRARQQELAA